MNFTENKRFLPMIIAVIIAAVAVVYYIVSGRGSYDSNVRELTRDSVVEKVESSDSQKITVTCRDGQNYQITFKEGHSNYDDLIFDACGPEGTQE